MASAPIPAVRPAAQRRRDAADVMMQDFKHQIAENDT